MLSGPAIPVRLRAIFGVFPALAMQFREDPGEEPRKARIAHSVVKMPQWGFPLRV